MSAHDEKPKSFSELRPDFVKAFELTPWDISLANAIHASARDEAVRIIQSGAPSGTDA